MRIIKASKDCQSCYLKIESPLSGNIMKILLISHSLDERMGCVRDANRIEDFITSQSALE